MSWDKAKDFGVIKVEGKRVKLYHSKDNHSTIVLNDEVKDARWAGDAVLVYLMDGKVKRYTSIDRYSTI